MIEKFTVANTPFPLDGELIPEGSAGDNLYLLAEDGTVLSLREARPLLKVGENLFTAFSTSEAEYKALSCALKEQFDTMYLMQCGPVPVLLMRYLWRGNHTLLAAVPDLPLAKALRTPAAYNGVLFPQDLHFSPLSSSRMMPADEEVFRMASEWIAPYRFLRAAKEEHEADAPGLKQFLKSRTLALARMCDVHVLYYYSGIGYATVLNVNYPKLMAALAATMLAVREAAREQTAYFSIERNGEEDPFLTVSFYLDEERVPGGIAHLLYMGQSHENAALFVSPHDKNFYHLRIPFCTKPVEDMGLYAFSIKSEKVDKIFSKSIDKCVWAWYDKYTLSQ